MVWWFFCPNITFGEDALSELETIQGKRAFIVTDKVINGLGLAEKVCRILTQRQWEAAIWDGVEPDPKVSTVKSAAEAIKRFGADWIIAVGGGSVMDTAKAAWVLYENPDVELHALTPFDELGLRTKARLVCIPTTTGTGSEATKAIVIRDDETGRKFATINPELTPDIALLDPEFVVGLPKNLTAYTGMDALTHAVEAYVSTIATPVTDACALKSIEIISRSLRAAVANGQDMEARNNMSYAQYLAGMAFNNASLGHVHAMAHQLGGFYDLPHGVCNAILLPHVQRFNMIAKMDRFVDIAVAMGEKVKNLSVRAAADKALEAIQTLSADIAIPSGLDELGVKEEDLKIMAENAQKDACGLTNPRCPKLEDVIQIYKNAM